MMAYIQRSDFDGYCPGNTLPEGDFSYLAARAGEMVDAMTGGKIGRFGFENFTEFTRERIQKATAAQVETLFAQGGRKALTGGAEGLEKSLSVGEFSCVKTDRGGLRMIGGLPISPVCYFYLQSTGLLYGGIGEASPAGVIR